MAKYLRIEMVEAEPITKAAFLKKVYDIESNDDKNKTEEGFLIKTKEGFSGWVSKKDFETKEYISYNSMLYPLAYYMLQKKMADYIRLPQWKEDVKIKAQFPDQFSKMTAPYTYVESRFGNVPHKTTVIEEWSKNWMVHWNSTNTEWNDTAFKLDNDGSMETQFMKITSDGVISQKDKTDE